MTPEIPDGLSDAEKAILARFARPIPLRVQRELAVCGAMDEFHAALDGTRAILSTALARPTEMSPYASPAAIQASWKDSLTELQVSFERMDQHAMALIRSIKVMLALE